MAMEGRSRRVPFCCEHTPTHRGLFFFSRLCFKGKKRVISMAFQEMATREGGRPFVVVVVCLWVLMPPAQRYWLFFFCFHVQGQTTLYFLQRFGAVKVQC